MGQVVRGLEFFAFSLIDVNRRKAYPLAVRRTVRSKAEKEAAKERKKRKTKTPKGKQKRKLRGRPKGVLNKDRSQLDLSPELGRINELLKKLLSRIRLAAAVKHPALDGHFGHNQAVLMAQANKLELISKLRSTAALFEEYDGLYGGNGRRRRYGARLNYEKLPAKYLKKSVREGEILTLFYQGIFLSKSFASAVNVVIIRKINLKKQKQGHCVLFSSDVQLDWEKLIDYYSLRFQIEFNFRDAKQHFGLEDFMSRTEVGIETAANLSFLMINLSAKLLLENKESEVGINDLKSRYRGVKYALETIKLIEPKAETILIERVKAVIGRIGSIHRPDFFNASP